MSARCPKLHSSIKLHVFYLLVSYFALPGVRTLESIPSSLVYEIVRTRTLCDRFYSTHNQLKSSESLLLMS